MELKIGYKQTEIGAIPNDWHIKTLNTVCDVRDGTHESPKFFSQGVPFVTSRNIVDGSIDLNGINFISKTDAIEFNKRSKVDCGDILMSMIGTIGNALLINTEPNFCIKNVALIKPQSINAGYLIQLINSSLFQSLLSDKLNGGIQKFIALSSLRDISISVPPDHEQTAIAHALSDADALIQSLQKFIAKKRQIKQGAMQNLLNPFENGALKKGWIVKTLGDILEKIIGGGTPSRANPIYWGNEIPWVTVKDFATHDPYKAQEYVTKEGLKNSASHLIPKGTIITSTRMALGKAVLYQVDVCINQDLKALFPIKDIDTTYLFYWFQFNENNIAHLGSGSTVMGISLDDLKKITFVQPPKHEQTRIATILADMDANIAALATKLAKYQQIKQGMMQNLLTGRIRLV